MMVVTIHAASLSGFSNLSPDMDISLTNTGSLDWAIWDANSDTAFAEKVTTNIKSGGPGVISSITAVAGDGSVRGASDGLQTFTYVDGVSPTSQFNSTIGMTINNSLGSIGPGVQLSVTGDSSLMYQVDIWTTGFRSVGEMTASLNGADDVVLYTDEFGTNGATAKVGQLFTFYFQPDSNSDLLNLSFVTSAVNASDANFAHVGIQAVAVTVVPEPHTTALLLGASAVVLAVSLRRRRASGTSC